MGILLSPGNLSLHMIKFESNSLFYPDARKETPRDTEWNNRSGRDSSSQRVRFFYLVSTGEHSSNESVFLEIQDRVPLTWIQIDSVR